MTAVTLLELLFVQYTIKLSNSLLKFMNQRSPTLLSAKIEPKVSSSFKKIIIVSEKVMKLLLALMYQGENWKTTRDCFSIVFLSFLQI